MSKNEEALRKENEDLKADRDSWEQQATDRLAMWYEAYQANERLINENLRIRKELNRLNGVKQIPALLKKTDN